MGFVGFQLCQKENWSLTKKKGGVEKKRRGLNIFLF